MGVMEARRRILLNQPHLIDASGNPISFSTDMAAKMGVKAHFSPVQSGSGDPSPSNVRPISGWTGCNVSHSGADTSNPTTYPVTFPATGKNLLNPELKIAALSSVCHIGYNNGMADGTFVLEAGTYTLSRVLTDGRSWSEGRAVDSQGNILARRYSDRNYISFTLQTKQAVGIYVSVFSGDYPATQSELQIESGSTATSYEPFTNTIYGGYVDYERGEVVAEWKHFTLNSPNNWDDSQTRAYIYVD